MGHREKLTILSNPRNLPKVRRAVEKLAEQIGFNQKQRHTLALAVDEALANVIKHAYEGAADKKIDIDIEELNAQADKQGLLICIRDFGKTVDACQIKGRDLSDVRPGGLGVHIMREVMDEVVFECPPSGGTCLRMIKYCRRSLKEK